MFLCVYVFVGSRGESTGSVYRILLPHRQDESEITAFRAETHNVMSTEKRQTKRKKKYNQLRRLLLEIELKLAIFPLSSFSFEVGDN